MVTANVDVLLIEDSGDDAELTIRAFKKRNPACSILHLNKGEEALDFIFCRGKFKARTCCNRPKLILLDLKMPRIDGMEMLKKIKGDARTKVIPTVILTSSKEDKDIIESYRLGANSFFVKPVDYTDFVEAVSSISEYWLLINRSPDTH